MIDAYAKLATRLNQLHSLAGMSFSLHTPHSASVVRLISLYHGDGDDLAAAVLAARELGVPYFVLGLGANILVGDDGFRGLVIRNHAAHFTFSPTMGELWVESGAVMARPHP